jgi:hypothetical protein
MTFCRDPGHNLRWAAAKQDSPVELEAVKEGVSPCGVPLVPHSQLDRFSVGAWEKLNNSTLEADDHQKTERVTIFDTHPRLGGDRYRSTYRLSTSGLDKMLSSVSREHGLF